MSVGVENPKLVHLVKKILRENPDWEAQAVVERLQLQYKEYQRKNAETLQASVQSILRKLDQPDDDPDYERLAVLNDQQRGAGGSLNESLRSRYQQQQQTTTPSEDKRKNGEPPESAKKRKKMRRLGSKFSDFKNHTDTSDCFLSPRPRERYTDLGGMGDIVQEIRQLVEYPLVRPELYRHLGVEPPRGVLLRGPPGTGKTHLANAIAGQLNVSYYRVSAPELVSGMSGESESRIRDLFRAASDSAPSIIFFDEIDAIAPKRSDDVRGMEKRIVAQLLTSMDELKPQNNRGQNAVIILAATNRPDSLDPALRRAGRFDREILLGVPDEQARERILQSMTASMRLQVGSSGFDFKVLARQTPGFVGADLKSLAKEAAVLAINRIFQDVLKEKPISIENGRSDVSGASSDVVPLSEQEMEPLFVTMDDFEKAIPMVQPSSQREGFATVPDVSWDDIGALDEIREELTLSVLEPIRAPEKFKALGLPLPAGVMLYGPPGCGKTLLAKAIANESGANFISVKGPELLDKYVGESEKAVRIVFGRARASSPCVVFFDELDSLVPRRGSESSSGVSERVVNQLLTEMDGLDSRRSVFVIAATNRPELIDPAMMRPGRLDKLLYVPLPNPKERVSILTALATNVTLGDDVDLGCIGLNPRAEGYSGADCAALLREAGLAVLKEAMEKDVPLCITKKHFETAFAHVLPSVTKKDQARYDRLRDKMARARSRGAQSLEQQDNDVASSG